MKKDYAKNHGMTHGAFRGFLTMGDDSKTAEERATERAVAEARANVKAKQKVLSLGIDLKESALTAELEAQAARARALAHLERHNCGPSQWELRGLSASRAVPRGNDNTLDAVAKRKSKGTRQADKYDKEAASLAARILTEKEAERHSRASQLSQRAGRVLPQWWKEVLDSPSGKSYYWNELTNETSWECPVRDNNKGGGGEEGWRPQRVEELLPGWKKKLHEATGQVLYENETTKERRWTPPLLNGSAGLKFGKANGSENARVKFSIGGAAGEKRKFTKSGVPGGMPVMMPIGANHGANAGKKQRQY